MNERLYKGVRDAVRQAVASTKLSGGSVSVVWRDQDRRYLFASHLRTGDTVYAEVSNGVAKAAVACGTVVRAVNVGAWMAGGTVEQGHCDGTAEKRDDKPLSPEEAKAKAGVDGA